MSTSTSTPKTRRQSYATDYDPNNSPSKTLNLSPSQMFLLVEHPESTDTSSPERRPSTTGAVRLSPPRSQSKIEDIATIGKGSVTSRIHTRSMGSIDEIEKPFCSLCVMCFRSVGFLERHENFSEVNRTA